VEVVVVVDGTVVVELEVLLLSGVDDVVVELVLVVDEVEVLLVLVLELLVVLVGDGRAAHGFGLQVPGPMSTPPVLRHARLVFTRHSGAPLAPARQHWIRWWPRCGPAASAPPPAPNRASNAVSQKRTAATRNARVVVDMTLSSAGWRTARCPR